MNTKYRRIVTAVASILGAYTGIFACFFPRTFYDSFPGAGFAWVSLDGPFSEHLIRDVGGLYLGLVAAGVWALFRRELIPTQVVGLAWTIFGAIHFSYHASHLEGLSAADAIGNVVALGGSLVLGILMVLPQPRQAHSSARAGVNADSECKTENEELTEEGNTK